MNKELKQQIADKRRKEDMNRVSNRLNNVARLLNSLASEYKMIKAIHDRMTREDFEKTPYDWKKDKSLSVNNE